MGSNIKENLFISSNSFGIYDNYRDSATKLLREHAKLLTKLYVEDSITLNEQDALIVYDGLKFLIENFHKFYDSTWVHGVLLYNYLHRSGVDKLRKEPFAIKIGSYSEKYLSEITQIIEKESLWEQLEQQKSPIDIPSLLKYNFQLLSLSGIYFYEL